jgi:hypothetical protein
MPKPYQARVDVRRFLNFPGFHDGAYIVAYVENTRARKISPTRGPRAFPSDPIPRPRTILEIADCGERINLEFSLHNPLQLANSLHKVDCLLSALSDFRQGLVEEADLYQQRRHSLKATSNHKASRRRTSRRNQ